MDTSLFLAKLIGPTMLTISAALLVNQQNMREMAADFLQHRGIIFLSGILALVAGIAIVLTHNVWVAGWPVIITILGWVSVIAGVFRVVFPDSVKSLGEDMIRTTSAFTVGGIIQGVIGAWLCYVSYMA